MRKIINFLAITFAFAMQSITMYSATTSMYPVSLSYQQGPLLGNYTYTIVNSFDINKSVEEYFNDLKMQTSDQKKKDALEICSIVLDGLQCVDDNDTTYVKAATDIIKNSNVSQELKTTLLNGVSVAHASAKLWNTDRIGTIHK